MGRFIFIVVFSLIYNCQTAICAKYEDSDEYYDYRQIDDHKLSLAKPEDTPAINVIINKEKLGKNSDQYEAEKKAGDMTVLLGKNVHFRQPNIYKDLGRRFVLQYPYHEMEPTEVKRNKNYLTPMKATPELVLAVAKESALLEGAKPINPTDEIIRKNILRTGDYWDSVWKEDVHNPAKGLRSKKAKEVTSGIEMLQARIKPGSKLYRLISVLKQISPRLLYVINNDDKT